jgi:sialate O-acetylesterase
MNTSLKLKNLFLFFFLIPVISYSQVRLPKLISDGMVLQRDTNVRIWGWASEGEKVSVSFIGSTYQSIANKNGEWEVILPELKAGGPHEMKIDASNSITISDIMVGDVWVCSGQSNMQSSLRGLTSIYQDEIEKSGNPNIRQFLIYSGFNMTDRETDYRSGRWASANPKEVPGFTAVGYFFAKKLYETYKVPIGLINASVGGSSAEAWISEESIKSFPNFYETVQRFKTPGYIDRINKMDNERVRSWNKQLRQNDEGFKDPQRNWYSPELNTDNWETMYLPGYWADTKVGPVNGVVWFRKEITVPATLAGKQASLKLGRVADADSVFINGRFVGTTGSQYSQRTYRIPADLLREGKNTIVIRVINYIRHGGFVPGKQYEISADGNTVNLEGEWKYRIGATAEQLEDRLFTGKIPTGLFKGMIAPMLNYGIKGVVWYQGESNTSRAFEHYELFKLLIKDWRLNWRQGDFPFLYVQLPNFVEVNIETTKYDWAYFRETQLKALAIPNTGMAVTIDIGEYNDIHPVNKKDVGYRLALAAQKIAYGEKQIVYSGPVYKSSKIEGNKVTLSFSNVGSGLTTKNGEELNCFEICGIDNEYYPALAKIVKDKIIVWKDDVINPVAVRYAWANNPLKPNLYNKEGLPASPFRTSELY